MRLHGGLFAVLAQRCRVGVWGRVFVHRLANRFRTELPTKGSKGDEIRPHKPFL